MADDEKRNDPPWGRPLDPSDMEREGGAEETRPRDVQRDASQDTPPSGTPVPDQVEGPPEDMPYYPPPPPPGESVDAPQETAPAQTQPGPTQPGQTQPAQVPDETQPAQVPDETQPAQVPEETALSDMPPPQPTRGAQEPVQDRPTPADEEVPDNIVAQTREGEHP